MSEGYRPPRCRAAKVWYRAGQGTKPSRAPGVAGELTPLPLPGARRRAGDRHARGHERSRSVTSYAAPRVLKQALRDYADEAASCRARAEYWQGEARRLAAENATLAGTVAAQREQITALRQRLVTLSRILIRKLDLSRAGGGAVGCCRLPGGGGGVPGHEHSADCSLDG